MALTPRIAKSVPVRQSVCSHFVLPRHMALLIFIILAASAPSQFLHAKPSACCNAFVSTPRVALEGLASAREEMPPRVRPECWEYAYAGAGPLFHSAFHISHERVPKERIGQELCSKLPSIFIQFVQKRIAVLRTSKFQSSLQFSIALQVKQRTGVGEAFRTCNI